MRSKPKKKKSPIPALILLAVIVAAVIYLAIMMKGLSKPDNPGVIISGGKTTVDGSERPDDGQEIDTKNSIMSRVFADVTEELKTPLRSAFLNKRWADIGDEALNKYNGQGYYDGFPGSNLTVCTGYVGWAMTHVYGIKDYPNTVSTETHRNGGEFVDAHRLWLIENAEFIGSATTIDGVLEYHGGRYRPGDIIIFNCRRDGDEGTFRKSVSNPSTDYWGDEDIAYFTHVGIVGGDTKMWSQDVDTWELTDTGESLPVGQFNMHHNSWTIDGVSLILSPEQFITRDVDEDNMDFSRSYEIYRVLTW